VTGEIGPDYRRLMDLIRSRIASGEYPTGSQIPSTRKWEDDGWSRDVARTAITRLQADGILEGQSGKGVFVRATPEQAARDRVDLKSLSEAVAGIRQQIANLQATADRLESNLIELYGYTAYPYPEDGGHDTAAAGRLRRR
jgi:DNA-binding GntR family transcriptional regulator